MVENAAPGIPIEYRRAAVSKAVAAQLREAIETLIPELDQVGCVIIAHGRRSFSGHYRIVYSSDRPNPPAMLTAVTDDIAPGLVDFYPGRLDGNVIYVDRAANSGPA